MKQVFRIINLLAFVLFGIFAVFVGLIAPLSYLCRGVPGVMVKTGLSIIDILPIMKKVLFMNVELFIFLVSTGIMFALLALLFYPKKNK